MKESSLLDTGSVHVKALCGLVILIFSDQLAVYFRHRLNLLKRITSVPDIIVAHTLPL